MLNNRKAIGVTAPHPRSGNKISMEPRNGHRSGQVSQHKKDQILKKEKYTKSRKGSIHQIGGRSQTEQGSS